MATQIAITEDTTITRTAYDTYPVGSTVRLNKVPVNLEGWTVYLYYTEDQGDSTAIEVRITGVVSDPKKGKVKFYPRTMYCYDVTNSTEYFGLAKVGIHPYSIVRKKEMYEQNDAGGFVFIDGVYVVYDVGNPDHDDEQRYSPYTEVMTHAVGDINISTRSGV